MSKMNRSGIMYKSYDEGKFMDSVKIEVRLQHENPVDIITMDNF